MTALPKRLGHIWIGPKPAPRDWMDTWPKTHPDWSYTVFGNDTLTGFPFRLRSLINEYAWRGAWARVQDMMRYELLYRYGGFMADADSICLHPVDDLLDRARAYTVYDRPETDPYRGVCPILACEPQNPFVGAIIDRLATREPWELRKPEVSTGNRFLMSMIREVDPATDTLKIFPTHYFIPWQKSAPDVWYDGPDRIYAEQKWGTSMWSYNRAGGPSDEVRTSAELARGHADILDRLSGSHGQTAAPRPDATADRIVQADACAARLPAVLQDAGYGQDILDLNRTLIETMTGTGIAPVFQGLHFYRHMQQNPLTDSAYRSRSQKQRMQLLGWLGAAKRALVVGYDTGHLVATAMHVGPALQMTAVDAGRWSVEKDPDPPQRARYVPAAAAWLGRRFHDRLIIGAEPEETFMARKDVTAGGGYDLLLFAQTDITSFRVFEAARPLLSPGAIVVVAAPLDQPGVGFTDRLRVQDRICTPFLDVHFGSGRGGICAFHLKDKIPT